MSAETTAAIQAAAMAGGGAWARGMQDAHVPHLWRHIATEMFSAALDVPQMASAIVDHLTTDTLSGNSETLVCGGCGHVLVTGDPDDARDPQAEHATHLAALIRATLLGTAS